MRQWFQVKQHSQISADHKALPSFVTDYTVPCFDLFVLTPGLFAFCDQ